MIWFLRLFDSFRQLEMRCAEQAHILSLREQEFARLTENHTALQRELTETLKKTADAMARQATGRNVFMVASAETVATPAPSVRTPGVRELMAEENRRAIEQFHKVHGAPGGSRPSVAVGLPQ